MGGDMRIGKGGSEGQGGSKTRQWRHRDTEDARDETHGATLGARASEEAGAQGHSNDERCRVFAGRMGLKGAHPGPCWRRDACRCSPWAHGTQYRRAGLSHPTSSALRAPCRTSRPASGFPATCTRPP